MIPPTSPTVHYMLTETFGLQPFLPNQPTNRPTNPCPPRQHSALECLIVSQLSRRSYRSVVLRGHVSAIAVGDAPPPSRPSTFAGGRGHIPPQGPFSAHVHTTTTTRSSNSSSSSSTSQVIQSRRTQPDRLFKGTRYACTSILRWLTRS